MPFAPYSLLCYFLFIRYMLGRRQKCGLAIPRRETMVAVYLESYRQDWPQIGCILQVRDEDLKIQWYTGTMTSTWKPLTVRSEANEDEPWAETVSPTQLLSAPFSLTRTNRLPGEVKQELRKHYEQIYC